MPASAEEGRLLMFEWMRGQNPKSVLDIGAGSGTYGRLFRNGLFAPPYLIGVEAWVNYIHYYDLHAVYDQLLSCDIRTLPPGLWPRTDITMDTFPGDHLALDRDDRRPVRGG